MKLELVLVEVVPVWTSQPTRIAVYACSEAVKRYILYQPVQNNSMRCSNSVHQERASMHMYNVQLRNSSVNMFPFPTLLRARNTRPTNHGPLSASFEARRH